MKTNIFPSRCLNPWYSVAHVHLQVSDIVQQPFPTSPSQPRILNETVTPVQWQCVVNASGIGSTDEYRCALPHNSVWALNSDFYFDSSSPLSSNTFLPPQTIALGAALVALVFGFIYFYLRGRARLNNRVRTVRIRICF